jgi:propanol-preferring alcohol dehydrogenase
MILHTPAPIESRPLALANVPEPRPGPSEVRVRLRACGVCRTDLHIAEGDLSLVKRPVVLGHQAVGTIDAIGAGVNWLAPGERVGVAWLHEACGRCGRCTRGLENLCDAARFTGWSADGGFAEALVAPAAFVYRVPERFDHTEAAPLLCAGVVGYRALKLSGAIAASSGATSSPPTAGAGAAPRAATTHAHRLGLFGFGASAHIVLQAARHVGCEVLVFTRGAAHRRLALDLGASWAGRAEDDPGAPLDAAISFAPSGTLVPRALALLAPGGTLALAGIALSQVPPLDYDAHLYRERALRSVTAATRRDAEELLALAAAAAIRPEIETFPLDAANEALRAVKESRVRGAAVLVV